MGVIICARTSAPVDLPDRRDQNSLRREIAAQIICEQKIDVGRSCCGGLRTRRRLWASVTSSVLVTETISEIGIVVSPRRTGSAFCKRHRWVRIAAKRAASLDSRRARARLRYNARNEEGSSKKGGINSNWWRKKGGSTGRLSAFGSATSKAYDFRSWPEAVAGTQRPEVR